MPVTTAVVLGGGLGRRFGVLTSRDSPKALLPVANAPLLSYPIEWVAASGLQEALIVAGAPLCCHWPRFCADALYAAGDAAASAISRWVNEDYKGSCKLTVIGALALASHSTLC